MVTRTSSAKTTTPSRGRPPQKKNAPPISNWALRLFGAVLALVVLISVVSLARTIQKRSQDEAAVAQGISVLESLSSRSVNDIEESIKADRRKVKQAAFVKALEEEDFSIAEAYEDSVICGDSRSVGIELYGVLDGSHVLADIGASITKLENDVETLKTINPTFLFLCYGLNDILNYGNDNAKGFVADYKTIIQTLQKELPSTQICVDSILPVLDGANVDQSAIDAYNVEIKAMCEELGVQYIDSTGLLRDENNQPINTEYYEPDNEHFTRAFLEPWLKQMMTEAYNYEPATDTDEDA